ncbi:unnamed protein product [Darwinula stevensoni]|uniref:Uncharacterized protein n=1 Tax=Darwinula stevensoni TaxID=69355 RepID=A0A7R9AH08_9CRUS|nr:unnamed protein product [Darwinula stevensoni]CAG0904668.1 unnamed protein product [Darwinula stevensoni]
MRNPKSQDEVFHIVQQGDLEKLREYASSADVELDHLVSRGSGDTPLHVAARIGALDVIRYLVLECGIKQSIEKANKDGKRPLHEAALYTNLQCAKFLLDYALHGRRETVEILLKVMDQLGDSLDLTDSCGTTPLFDALRAGHVDTAMTLVHTGKVNVHHKDKLGRTLVHVVAQAGQVPSLEYVVSDLCLNINCQTDDGTSPLHLAARENRLEAVSFLLHHRANPHTFDSTSLSPLDVAREWKRDAVIKLLVDHEKANEQAPGIT